MRLGFKKVTVYRSVDLAISKQAFIEASKAKPTFTAEQGAVAFARQGLGSVSEWTEDVICHAPDW